MKKQQGFTLIELMIAVAIIGILAAVAIPQYQSYVARAQVSEAVTLLGGLKTPVIDYYAMNGEFPSVGSTGQISVTTTGEFVDSITEAAEGVYIATFKGSDVNQQLFSAELAMVFSSTGNVTCTATDSNITSNKGVPSALLPKSCQ